MQTRRLHQLSSGANDNRREEAEASLWVVDLGGGEMRLVRGIAALKELVARAGLPKTARVYKLSATPSTLGDLSEAASVFDPPTSAPPAEAEAQPPAETAVAPPDLAPPEAEPPIAVAEAAIAPAEAFIAPAPTAMAPPHAAMAPPQTTMAPAEVAATNGASARSSPSLDADFSLLDRPLEDDADFFEDPPRRWPRLVGGAVVLALIGGGAYRLVSSRHHAPSVAVAPPSEPAAVARAAPPAEPAVAAAPSPPAQPPPVVAAAAPAASPAVAAAPKPPPLPDPPVAAPARTPAAEPPAGGPSYSQLVASGKRLFDAGRGRKAEALFEQALALKGTGTEALVGLAYVDLDRGKKEAAIDRFKQALDQDASYAPAVFGLAESYRQQGNRSEALAAFKRFLTLQSSGDEADLARRLVRELGRGH
jgi:hypothetical protein